eukprot:TRINITY_DN27442_c0_g2_i1.p1 TRINITY_DN27442_c0_g2~~TRINITY_DN27442_c0_g2_i1.p1  ORF type:complete len:475 (-),score=133.97 TRINITY_DN27442_c0_g2_i1:153-1577(-)
MAPTADSKMSSEDTCVDMEEAAEEEDDESGEEEDDEESDDEGGNGEMVGYLEDPPASAKERKLLHRSNFPSKLGGKPAWLVPRGLPEVSCKQCSRPMRFLMQVYASRGEQEPGAFHRAVFLFVCTNCQPNEVRAFRAQLPRQNDIYSSEAPKEADVLKKAANDEEIDALTCWDCGLAMPAPEVNEVPEDPEVEEVPREVSNRCDECARLLRSGEQPAVFQERELSTEAAVLIDDEDVEEDPEVQSIPPPTSNQKQAGGYAGASSSPPGAPEGAWNEKDAAAAAASSKEAAAEALAGVEAAIEAAKNSGKAAEDDELMKKLKEFKDRVAANPEHAIDGTEQSAFEEWSKERGEKDNTFSRFQRYSRENEAHVIRYHWGDQPLWFCGQGKLKSKIPCCEACGAERVFELQVQPQLIGLLLDTTAVARRLDFGTICVYSCSQSCCAKITGSGINSAYIEEFAYVQPEPGDAWLPSSD